MVDTESSQTAHEEELPRPFGRFTLLRVVGRGGMGTVYEAADKQLGRHVALKTAIATDGDATKRFLREQRIAAKLDHPNVVPVYDSGKLDGTLYYTMPLVQGLSFEKVIALLHDRGEEPPPDWFPRLGSRAERVVMTLQWFEGALAGLQNAHDRGIVHRDLKPSNLLLDADTKMLRIIDFGLARAEHHVDVTRAGSVLGTIAFMSPEQVRGDADRIDYRSDVYSMGVTLYRALLDRLPYTAATTAEYLNKILTVSPSLPRRGAEIPRDLTTILFKAMEKSRQDRYRSAGALRDDVTRFRRYEPILASPPSVAGRLFRWVKRKPAAASLVVVVGIVALVTGLLVTQAVQKSRLLRQQELESRLISATDALRSGSSPRALADFDRVLELDRRHVEARLGRVMALQIAEPSEERTRLALDDLAEIDRLRPGLASAALLRRRMSRGDDGRTAEAVPPADGALAAIDLRILGELARSEKRCDVAVPYYDELLRRDPRQPWPLLDRGNCRIALERPDEAREDFRLIAGFWPEDPNLMSNLGNAFWRMGDREASFAAFENALKIAPDHAVIRFNYGRVLLADGDRERAAEHLKESVRLDGEYLRARNDLGRLLRDLEKPWDAASQFLEIIRIGEARGDKVGRDYVGKAWVNLCDMHLRFRNMPEADQACRTCVELFPRKAESHYNLATLQILSGDREGALASLERDVELGDKDYKYLEGDEAFEPLRGDPRFEALLERMGRP